MFSPFFVTDVEGPWPLFSGRFSGSSSAARVRWGWRTTAPKRGSSTASQRTPTLLDHLPLWKCVLSRCLLKVAFQKNLYFNHLQYIIDSLYGWESKISMCVQADSIAPVHIRGHQCAAKLLLQTPDIRVFDSNVHIIL